MCYSDEHVLRWDLLDDLEYPELYASVFLNQYHNVFKRVWIAVKYIFGYKCRYGHWDCFLLNPQDIGRMTALLEAYREAVNSKTLKETEVIKSRGMVDVYSRRIANE